LASIYEEKSTEQIAAQVGLSENATRQLIFRARAAFKKALLGDDVNTNGMSAAAILSVAARKAAAEAKKVGAQAMVFVLFLMLAIGAFVNFTGRGTQTQQVAEPQKPATSNESPAPVASESASTGEVVQVPATTPNTAAPKPVQTVKPALPVSNVAAAKPSANPSVNPVSGKALTNIYNTSPDVAFVSKSAVKLTVDNRQDYMVAASQGAFAEFSFDADDKTPFQDVKFTLTIDGKQFTVYASKSETVTAVDKNGLQHFVFYSSMKYFVDANGKVWDQSDIAQGTMRLELVIDNAKRTLTSSVLTILPSE
jgi:RNA polymerase sigma-70 factor (ECF subfamily)